MGFTPGFQLLQRGTAAKEAAGAAGEWQEACKRTGAVPKASVSRRPMLPVQDSSSERGCRCYKQERERKPAGEGRLCRQERGREQERGHGSMQKVREAVLNTLSCRLLGRGLLPVQRAAARELQVVVGVQQEACGRSGVVADDGSKRAAGGHHLQRSQGCSRTHAGEVGENSSERSLELQAQQGRGSARQEACSRGALVKETRCPSCCAVP